jgi:cytosine permease
MQRVKKRYEIENYPLSPIPEKARSKWFRLTIVWAGFVLAVSNFMTGSLISEGLSLSSSFMAIFHGNMLLLVVAIIMGFIAQETGLSTAYLSRYAFGIGGSKFVSVLFSLSFIGWSGIGIGLAAKSLSHFTGWGEVFLSIVLTMIFGITAIYGFRGMVKISSISVPVIVLLSCFGIYEILATRGLSFSMLMLIEPAEPIGLGQAVSIVVGSWIVGAVAAPDILRFALRKRDVLITLLLAFLVFNSLQMCVGAVMGVVVGSSDLPEILYHLGFGLYGVLLLLFLSWTTSDNNFYAAGLGISNFLDHRDRIKPTIFSIVAAGVLAIMGVYNYLGYFLSLVSLVFAPIGGVIIVDFFLYRVGLIDHALYYQGVRWKGIIAVALGIFLGVWIEFAMPFATAFGAAAIAYLLICLATMKRNKNPKDINE